MTEETKVFEFQPTDSDGKPLGLPVRIEYTDQEDLKAKLASEALRMKFTVSRDKVKAPDSAERFTNQPLDEKKIQADALEFIKTTPAYHPCRENLLALGRWLDDNQLATTFENLRLAFATLSKNGLLLGSDGKPTTSDDPTGISYTDNNGRTYYGKQAVERMPAEIYKRRFNSEFGFTDKVERLYVGK